MIPTMETTMPGLGQAADGGGEVAHLDIIIKPTTL